LRGCVGIEIVSGESLNTCGWLFRCVEVSGVRTYIVAYHMGAAPSFRLRSLSTAEGKDNNPNTRSFTSQSRPVSCSEELVPYEDVCVIDKSFMRVCELSWKLIATNNAAQSRNDQANLGIFAFCDRFFIHMEELDIDLIATHKFKPRSISRCPSRNALLLKIIKYMLSLPSDRFSSKAKVRRLGRAHATRGIREPQFKIFAEAFMRSFCEVLGPQLKPDMQRSWGLLLAFFVRELSFENVQFVPHIFHQVESTAQSTQDALSAQTGSGEDNEDSSSGSLGAGLLMPFGMSEKSMSGFASSKSVEVELDADNDVNVDGNAADKVKDRDVDEHLLTGPRGSSDYGIGLERDLKPLQSLRDTKPALRTDEPPQRQHMGAAQALGMNRSFSTPNFATIGGGAGGGTGARKMNASKLGRFNSSSVDEYEHHIVDDGMLLSSLGAEEAMDYDDDGVNNQILGIGIGGLGSGGIGLAGIGNNSINYAKSRGAIAKAPAAASEN
jgi:hemoglobin-like flavoprotein